MNLPRLDLPPMSTPPPRVDPPWTLDRLALRDALGANDWRDAK